MIERCPKCGAPAGPSARYNIEAASKFYARASAWRAVNGKIPDPDATADNATWEKTPKGIQNSMRALITAVCHAGSWTIDERAEGFASGPEGVPDPNSETEMLLGKKLADRDASLALAREALAGLIGLTELIGHRDDLPGPVKDALVSNHRVVEARATLARLSAETRE